MESRQYTFNKSTLTIRFGNIIESQSEVIVSSDDCYVTMGGGVSRAILRTGGEAIVKDVQKKIPVALGDVAVTTAGAMKKQKYIFHCITIDRERQLQMLESHVTKEDILDYILEHII